MKNLPAFPIFSGYQEITPGVRVIGLFAGAVSVFLLDRWSKRMVETRLADSHVAFAGMVQLRYVASRRVRYSNQWMRLLLVLTWFAALGSAIILTVAGTYFQTEAAAIALGAALGGAAGNLFEILKRHGVTDFIDFGWWPAFNVADAAIVIGLTVALWPTG